MNYNILNKVIIEWDNSNIPQREDTFLGLNDIKSKFTDTPDFTVLQKFSVNANRKDSVDGRGELHDTYSGILPAEDWSINYKYSAGKWDNWIDYITFPDFPPVANIKFVMNSKEHQCPRDYDLEKSTYNFGFTFEQIIESAEKNNGCVNLSSATRCVPTRVPFSYEEIIEYCPNKLFNVNFYIKNNVENFPSNAFYRMPWTQGIKFYNTGKFKIFNTNAFGFWDLKIPLNFPEGTKQLKKGILSSATAPGIYIPKSVTSIETGALELAPVRAYKDHACYITIPTKFKKRVLDIFYPRYKGWWPSKDFTGTIDELIDFLEKEKNIKFTFI